MNEYIEKEPLLKIAKELQKTVFGSPLIVQAIEKAPVVDVVEVVRCKDCKYYKQNPYSPDEDMMCMCWCDWLPTDPDDFCSYGERED